jgi:hypothetical protein
MINDIKDYLEAGYDPNYCYGAEEGWPSNNPLNVLGVYDTYVRRRYNQEILYPAPNIVIFHMLIDAGADIHMRPYVWGIVYRYSNDMIEYIKNEPYSPYDDLEKLKPEEAPEKIKNYVDDVNHLLEEFLKTGADPDKLGHPYPFTVEAFKKNITDEEANEYFARGSRAINEAIKKGMCWESQVDLLLQYTTLDEASIEAARESGDPAMVEKINRMWQEQNKTKT